MNTSRFTFKVPGGLGNQLFSYYCAAYVAQSTQETVGLNFSSVDRSHFTESIPLLSMTIPNSSFMINNQSLHSRKKLSDCSRAQRLAAKLNSSRRSKVFLPGADTKTHIDDFLKLGASDKKKALIIEGYFGDFDFFDSVELNSFPIALNNPSQAFLELREEFSTSIYASVHHRLGDFLGLGDSVGILNQKYYDNSFQVLRGLGIRQFKIFTNDIELSKKIFNNWGLNTKELQWINSSLLFDPFENLLLMGSSKALICSNSTFSFWAGKMSRKGCETILYPRTFRRDGLTEIKSIPSSWYAIDSSWELESFQ